MIIVSPESEHVAQVIKECIGDDHYHHDNPDPRDVARLGERGTQETG